MGFRRIQLTEHKLIIDGVQWDDQGMYQCFLTNDVGEDTRSTWLKIKSKLTLKLPAIDSLVSQARHRRYRSVKI